MNSDKRMAELYLERAAGKKHLWLNIKDEWKDLNPNEAFLKDEWKDVTSNDIFLQHTEYKLKTETLDEAIIRIIRDNQGNSTKYCMYLLFEWIQDNPESKDNE